jgi:hypothetical protein
MKIFFVGDLRSPFIVQNLKLLSEQHDVTIFDLGLYSTSFWQISSYIIYSFLTWRSIRYSDIVWVWFADYPAIPFVILSKIFKIPIVVNVGGWEVCKYPEINYGSQLNPIRGYVTRWILRNCTACICMSNAYFKIIKNVEQKSNVYVILGFVNTNLCFVILPEKHGVVTAVCTSHTKLLKGIPDFEQATKDIDAKVIKNVSHDHLLFALKHAKVYCQLSYTESFGITLLEAMACGCVPVVTNRDALPEVVGDAGVVVHYGNVSEIKSGILKALTMSGDAARERAKLFTEEKTRLLINELLEKII